MFSKYNKKQVRTIVQEFMVIGFILDIALSIIITYDVERIAQNVIG